MMLFGMPWCSVLLLSSGLSYVVFCWGLSVLLGNGQGCLGFAKEVLVGCLVWCVSVLVCSVSGLCSGWLVVGMLSHLFLGLEWLLGLVGPSPEAEGRLWF